MVGYLSKFIRNLSDEALILRELEKKDIEWNWTDKHQQVFNKLKSIISSDQTLKYYDPNSEVTIQCDASDYGLGAVLLQNEQPVYYASRALTSAERNYPQIDKEALAIVFSVHKFHEYVYGRKIKIISDHKPLESIFRKEIFKAPKRLQRMLIALQ